MSFLDKKLKLNQINIPGTHDTGIYDIGKVWKSSTENNKIIDGSFFASVKSLTAQTQDLNIKDQLKNGIRYLDIRLHLDAKDNHLIFIMDISLVMIVILKIISILKMFLNIVFIS